MRRIRRPSHGTAIAYLALFIALGGTAMAAIVVSNNNQVAPNTISGHKPPTGKHANLFAGSVNGQDVANGSIGGAKIAASALPTGRKITSSCDPTSTTFVDCGTMTINLPRSGLRVLIVASAMWHGVGSGQGTCRIGVNGAPFGPNAFPGDLGGNHATTTQDSVTLTNVTNPNLGAGNHTFGLACNQRGTDDIKFDETMVSAVVLGPG